MPNMVAIISDSRVKTPNHVTDFLATAEGPTGIFVSIYRYPDTHLERESREYPDGDSCLLSPGILLATGFSRRVKTISDGPSPVSYWYTQTIGENHERRRRGSEARQKQVCWFRLHSTIQQIITHITQAPHPSLPLSSPPSPASHREGESNQKKTRLSTRYTKL